MVGPPSSSRKDQEDRVPASFSQPLNVRLLGRPLLIVVFASLPVLTSAQVPENGAAHTDPVTPVILALAIILAAAKLFGHLAVRIGQPAVLGELIAGIVLGSVDHTGIGWFSGIETDQTI